MDDRVHVRFLPSPLVCNLLTDHGSILHLLFLLHSFCVQLIMVPLYPAVISPLFNKFTLLPKESPVYPRIEALAKKLNFPLGKVWVIDGSVRSSHSNAYFVRLFPSILLVSSN